MANLLDELEQKYSPQKNGGSLLDRLEQQAINNGEYTRPAPVDDGGFLSNIWKGGKSGVASMYGGIADIAHLDSAGNWFNDVVKANQRARNYDSVLSWNYWTDPSGAAYDAGNAIGSVVATAPAAFLLPETVAASGAATITGLLGRLGAQQLVKTAAKKAATEAAAKTFVRGAATAIPGSLSEGGQVRRTANEEGLPDADARAWKTAAMNLPTLALSGGLEYLLLGGKAFHPSAKAGESIVKRAAKAPFRAVPAIGANAAQEGAEELVQQTISDAQTDKPWGNPLNPAAWTPSQRQAFEIGAAMGGMLGGAANVPRGMFVNNDPLKNQDLEEAQRIIDESKQQSQPIDTEPTAQPAMSVQEAQSRISAPTISAENSLDGFDSRFVSKWESKPGATDLAGVQPSVKNAFNAAIAEYGDGVTLTGGAEKGYHAAGEEGHEGGWKIDVDKASVKDPQKFLQAMARHGFQVGDEGDHYDLSGNAKGGVGGTVVATPDSYISNGQSRGTGKREGHANAWAAYDVFRKAGYNDEAIAGILGRLQQEHNFDTSNVEEYDDEQGRHLGGYGMFQWNGGRTTAFLNWAQENNLDPQNPEVQAQYALIEAQQRGLTPERMNQLTAEEAADVWTDEWEVGQRGSERQYAAEWRDRIKNGGSSAEYDDISSTKTKVDTSEEDKLYDEYNKQLEELAQNGIEAPFKTEQPTQKELVQQAKDAAIEAGDMDEVQRINSAERSGNKEELAKIAEKALKAKQKEVKGKPAPAKPEIKVANTNLINQVKQLLNTAKEQGVKLDENLLENTLKDGSEENLQNFAGMLQGMINVQGYENRKAKGKELLDYADDNQIDFKPGLRKMLREGQPKAIEAAQNIINEAQSAPKVQPANDVVQSENTPAPVQVESAQNQPTEAQRMNAKQEMEEAVLRIGNSHVDGTKGTAKGILNRALENKEYDTIISMFPDEITPVLKEINNKHNLPMPEPEKKEVIDYDEYIERTQGKKKGKEQPADEDYHGFFDDKKPGAVREAKKRLEEKINPFGDAEGFRTVKSIVERWAENDESNQSSTKGRSYYVHGNKVSKAAYDYYNHLVNSGYGKAQQEEPVSNEDKMDKAGDKSAETKKATEEGGKYTLADGFKTESGRSLTEADKDEFIIQPNGSKDFGEITDSISKAVKDYDLPAGKIRLRVGDKSEGLIHAKDHEDEAKDAGYDSIEALILDVASSFDKIYMREPETSNGNMTYSLVKTGNKSQGVMNGVAPVYLNLESDGEGNYYLVITAMPKGDRNLKRQTKNDRLIYSSPGLDAATTSNGGSVSRPASNDVGAEQGVLPASDKSNGSSASIVSQEQKEVTQKDSDNELSQQEKGKIEVETADSIAKEIKDIAFTYGEKVQENQYETIYTVNMDKVPSKEAANKLMEGTRGRWDGRRTMKFNSKKSAEKFLSHVKDTYGATAIQQEDKYNGFLKGMSPLQQGRADKALSKLENYNGKIAPRAEIVEELVAGGGHAEIKGKEYRFYKDNGAYLDLTKVEYDYAKYLENKNVPKQMATQDFNTTNFDVDGNSVKLHDKTATKAMQKQMKALADNHGGTVGKDGSVSFKTKEDRNAYVREAEALLSVEKPESSADIRLSVAWTGSPTDFDTFSLDYIGTGEGAQAHGYGLYSAANRVVAQGYRDKLSEFTNPKVSINGTEYERTEDIDGDIIYTKNGEPLPWGTNDIDAQVVDYFIFNNFNKKHTKEAIEKQIQEFEKGGKQYEGSIENARKIIERLNSADIKKISGGASGKLYQVEIPDNDVLLDEQKPLSQQPEKVKEAIIAYYKTRPDYYGEIDAGFKLPQTAGKYFYKDVIYQLQREGVSQSEAPKEASLLLNELGIKGITYEGGRDGRCFVIFDDQAIEIINKFSAEGEIRRAVERAVPVANEDLTPQQRKMSEFGKQMGTPILWISTDPKLHGFHAPNGTTVLNVRSNMDLSKTFWHETFHWIANNNESLYNELMDYFKGKKAFSEKQLDAYRKKIGRPGISDELAIEEMLADNFEEVTQRVKIFKEMGAEQPSLARKFVAWVKRIMDKFAEFFHNPEGKLTTAQRDSFVKAFGRLARDMKDGNGRPLFKVYKEGKEIKLPNGRLVTEGIKLSAENDIDKDGKVSDNEGKKYALKEHMAAEHNEVENKVVLSADGKTFEEMELGLPIGDKETETERSERRLKEIESFDKQIGGREGQAAFIKLVPESSKRIVDGWIARGETWEDVYKGLLHRFNRRIGNYSEKISEKKIIQGALALKGVGYYAAKQLGRTVDEQRVGGIFDERVNDNRPGTQAGEKGNPKNSITTISRSEEDGYSYARSLEELKQEAKESFPGAKVKDNGNSLEMTMPNGQKVTVSFEDSITPSEDELSKAKAAHGIDQNAVVTVEGYAKTVNGDGFVALSKGSRKGTGFHEAYHIAEAVAFTGKELRDAKRLISPNEEERADAYAKWKTEKQKNGNFAKLWHKIADTAAKFISMLGVETKRNLYRKVESGEVYKRDNAEAKARTSNGIGETKYSIGPSNNTNKGLLAWMKNTFSREKIAEDENWRYRKRLKIRLANALQVQIKKGDVNGSIYPLDGYGYGKVIFKEKEKVIRSQHDYDFENILPLAGAIIAEKLGMVDKWTKATEEQRNYITKWIVTGAPNDTSAVAKEFAKAMQGNQILCSRLEALQDEFLVWNQMSYDEQMKRIVSFDNQKKASWKEVKKRWYEEFVEEAAPIDRFVNAVNAKREADGKEKLNELSDPSLQFRLLRGYFGNVETMIENHTAPAVEALKKKFPNIHWDKFKTLRDILESIDAYQDRDKQKDFVVYCLAHHVLDIHKHNDSLEDRKAELMQKKQTLQDEIDEFTKRRDELEKEHWLSQRQRKEVKLLEKNIAGNNKRIAEFEEKLENMKAMPTPKEYSRENCESYIKDYDKKYGPNFRKAQQDLVTFSNMSAEILYDSGVISYKRYQELVNSWPNYVPMHRVFDENEDIDFGDSLKHIEGSTRDIINPLEPIIRNTADFIKRAEVNKARQLLANIARCDSSAHLIEEKDAKDNEEQTITFYENGQKRYLVTDPAIVRAVNNFLQPSNTGWFVKTMHVITVLARAAFTTANPEFFIRNAFRDYQDANLLTKYGYVISLRDIINGFRHFWNRDEVYLEWLTQGGAQASVLALDRDYTQATLNKMSQTKWQQLKTYNPIKFGKALVEIVQRAGEYTEYATRIATYEHSKRAIKEKNAKASMYDAMAAAALESRDLMDFARHGKAGAEWNKLVAFSNASIQGFDKLYRNLSNPETRGKTIAKLVLYGILPTLALFMLNKDDDEYKQAEKWLKETHWLIPIGDGKFLRIPKAADAGIRFISSMVEKNLEKAYYGKSHENLEYLTPLWDAMPGIMPTALLPISEVVANYDSFTGRPIVPQKEQKLPAKLQYGEHQTKAAKAFSQLLDIVTPDELKRFTSPRMLEHLIIGYSGTMGMAFPKAIDLVTGEKSQSLSVTELPIIRGFLWKTYKSPESVNDFYKALDKQTKLKNEYKLTHQKPEEFNPAQLKRLEQAQKMMQNIKKQEKAIIDNDKWSISDKEAMQRNIQKKRIEIAKRALGQK